MIEDKFVDLYARNSGLRDKLVAERDVVLTYALRALLDASVMDGGTEEPDVVGLAEELHQVVDEPARRRCSGLPVLHGHDDKEATTWYGEAALGHQTSRRLFERLIGDAERSERLLARQDVPACSLIRIDQFGELVAFEVLIVCIRGHF